MEFDRNSMILIKCIKDSSNKQTNFKLLIKLFYNISLMCSRYKKLSTDIHKKFTNAIFVYYLEKPVLAKTSSEEYFTSYFVRIWTHYCWHKKNVSILWKYCWYVLYFRVYFDIQLKFIYLSNHSIRIIEIFE